MQTTAVLLIELARGPSQNTIVRPNVIATVDKMARWLQRMKTNDAVSQRAYTIVCGLRNTIENPSHLQALGRRQENRNLSESLSPTISDVSAQPLGATKFASSQVSSHEPHSQRGALPQAPMYHTANSTAFPHDQRRAQDSHVQGNFNLQHLARQLAAPQDAVHFSQGPMVAPGRDPLLAELDNCAGWDALGLDEWMAQD